MTTEDPGRLAAAVRDEDENTGESEPDIVDTPIHQDTNAIQAAASSSLACVSTGQEPPIKTEPRDDDGYGRCESASPYSPSMEDADAPTGTIGSIQFGITKDRRLCDSKRGEFGCGSADENALGEAADVHELQQMGEDLEPEDLSVKREPEDEDEEDDENCDMETTENRGDSIAVNSGEQRDMCAQVLQQTTTIGGQQTDTEEAEQAEQAEQAGDKPYKCSWCGKSFAFGSQFTMHTRTHTGDKPYRCYICDRTFSRASNCKTHLKMHTGEHRCGVCDKAFSTDFSLRTHMNLHTGDRPHACDVCGKAFADASNLRGHMVVHTGKKAYKCELCDKAFSKKSSLSRHHLTHTAEKPYACTVCGKSFTQNGNLVTHVRTHSAEKPYACSQCGKSFTASNDLKRHQRIHTGEKPYACDVCEKAFTQSGQLKAHKQTMHTTTTAAGGKGLKRGQVLRAEDADTGLVRGQIEDAEDVSAGLVPLTGQTQDVEQTTQYTENTRNKDTAAPLVAATTT